VATAPSTETAVRRRTRSPAAITAALALVSLPWTLLQAIAPAVIPAASQELGGTSAQAAWVLTGYLFAGVIANLVAGPLGNRLGLRAAVVGCLVIALAGSAVAALATNTLMLVVGRVLQGACGAAVPLAYAMARRILHDKDAARAIVLLGTVFSLGGLVGLTLAGPIVDLMSLRWLFTCAAILFVISIAVAVAILPPVPRDGDARLNLVSTALLSGALCSVLLGLNDAAASGWTDPRALTLFVGSVLLALAWFLRDRRGRNPVVDLAVFQEPGIKATNLASLTMGAGMFATFVLVPQLVVSETFGFGMSTAAIGFVLAPSAVVSVLVSFPLARLMTRVPVRIVFATGTVVVIASYIMVLVGRHHLGVLLVANAIQGAGLALSLAACMTVASSVPPALVATSTGVTNIARLVGGALGSQLAASALVAFSSSGAPTDGGFVAGYVIAIALFVAAAVTTVFTQPRAHISAATTAGATAASGN
jgi:MFS family permease